MTKINTIFIIFTWFAIYCTILCIFWHIGGNYFQSITDIIDSVDDIGIMLIMLMIVKSTIETVSVYMALFISIYLTTIIPKHLTAEYVINRILSTFVSEKCE